MTFRPSHLVVPAYLVLSLALSWPLVRDFDTSVPAITGGTDPYIQAYILGWDFHALATDPSNIFNAPSFHPMPRTLTYMDHMIGEALVTWPVYLLTRNLAVVYNVLLVLATVGSGWAVYRLLRYLGLPRDASFLGGFLFAFSPFRFSHLGILNQSQTQFLPLAIFFGLRWFDSLRPRDLLGAAGVLVVQAWFGWYFAFYIGVALILLLVWKMAGSPVPFNRILRPRNLLVVLTCLLALLPGLLPYLEQQRAMPSFRRTIGMTVLWSADLLDHLKLPHQNRLAELIPALKGYHGFWPGFLTVILSIVTIATLAGRKPAETGSPASRSDGWLTVRAARSAWRWFQAVTRRWQVWGYFLLLSVVGFLLSLGPILQVAGKRYMVPLPYSAAYFLIPGFNSLRAPCRFAVLVVLGLSVLAAFGFHLLAKAADRSRRNGGNASGRRPLLFGAAFLVAILTSWPSALPLIRIPDPRTMPPVYGWIRDQPGDFAVLDLPMPFREQDETPLDGARQIYSLYYGKRRLDGVSGFVPPEYHVFRMVMKRFPRPGTVQAARRMGARYIVFHYADLSPDAGLSIRQAVAGEPSLREVATFGDDVVYEIVGG